jgi:predicted amidohydrolase YtcJ
LQVQVHAIGDLAIRRQLDIFERVAKVLGKPCKEFRFRIEHAQHISPADLSRFAELGVIASLQMSHLADDGCWAVAAIGTDRMKTSWPMRSLLREGAVVCLGSDWFVTEPDPLAGIYAAVTRRTIDLRNPDGLNPVERVNVEEALHGYTTGPAFAAFEEQKRGTLEVGKLADLVLLSRDIRALPRAEDILATKVLLTVVGGKIVFDATASNSKL